METHTHTHTHNVDLLIESLSKECLCLINKVNDPNKRYCFIETREQNFNDQQKTNL